MNEVVRERRRMTLSTAERLARCFSTELPF